MQGKPVGSERSCQAWARRAVTSVLYVFVAATVLASLRPTSSAAASCPVEELSVGTVHQDPGGIVAGPDGNL